LKIGEHNSSRLLSWHSQCGTIG